MILHTENLKDDSNLCEIARELSAFTQDDVIYDLIAGDGYEEEEGHPLCVIKDYGNRFDVIFCPYGQEDVQRRIFLEYYEADYLMKLLCYVDRQRKSKEKEDT